MDRQNTILIVEDQLINRNIIKRILSTRYLILEAEDGKEALAQLEAHPEIKVILLDIVMPVMNGFEFLEKLEQVGKNSIPVVVMTADNDKEMERRALDAGALDFVSKPVDPEILLRRVHNALERNQMILYQKMEWTAAHDSLTGLYNRRKMFAQTRIMLDKHPETTFAFVRFDIDKFRLYNSVMGETEGDKLLCYVAELLQRVSETYEYCTYGRIDADVFCLCCPYEQKQLEHYVRIAQESIGTYKADYRLKSSLGICIIEDKTLNIETIFTHASLASDKCKRQYDTYFTYYDNEMSESLVEEQNVMNDMKAAFAEEQFEVYLQPKYDLSTDMAAGAEALVRWRHPSEGLLSPARFIPIFEKNGCVAELDHYMWEHVCALLHKWLQEGKHVEAVSVNMSRVSLYNPHVAEEMQELIRKYEIPAQLLNLEVTESAYMSNPAMMKETVKKLQDAGFIILMDDFGSGYSSLNTLKEINIDILKLDMKFLPNGYDMGTAEKIISSIVRMAGWLGMQVIAEGVETKEQKVFLESVGCGYVQGYYYAKPMPVAEYETIMEQKQEVFYRNAEHFSVEEIEAFWSSDPRIEQILAGIEIPLAIIETSSTITECVRTNHAYQKKYGMSDYRQMRGRISPEEEAKVSSTFRRAMETDEALNCEISYITAQGTCEWVRIKVKRITRIPNATLLCCVFEEVTTEKLNEVRLNNLLQLFTDEQEKKMLVIDDIEPSRAAIRVMFDNKYEILEAADGEEGLALLEEYHSDISVVLLDMIMPKVDGRAFLRKKNEMEHVKDIPVIVISAEDNVEEQVGMLKNGVHDYIVKPFDPDITRQKVENAIANQKRFKKLIYEYQKDMEMMR